MLQKKRIVKYYCKLKALAQRIEPMPRQVSVNCARFVEWLQHEIYAEQIDIDENGIQFIGHDFRPNIMKFVETRGVVCGATSRQTPVKATALILLLKFVESGGVGCAAASQ